MDKSLEEVLERANILIFDLDKTLTKKDTTIPFLFFIFKRHPVKILKFPQLFWLGVKHFLMHEGDGSSTKREFLKVMFKGLRKERLYRLGEEFALSLNSDFFFKDGLDIISTARSQNKTLILASASLDLYVDTLAQKLNFDHCIATKPKFVDGRFEGEFLDSNNYGNSKCENVKVFFEEMNFKFEDSVSLSDSPTDWPLLKVSKNGIAVNPTKKLLDQIASDETGTVEAVVWK
ncbi:MAG: HAD-IB family hydrolase [Lentilitoribacter sp.]